MCASGRSGWHTHIPTHTHKHLQTVSHAPHSVTSPPEGQQEDACVPCAIIESRNGLKKVTRDCWTVWKLWVSGLAIAIHKGRGGPNIWFDFEKFMSPMLSSRETIATRQSPGPLKIMNNCHAVCCVTAGIYFVFLSRILDMWLSVKCIIFNYKENWHLSPNYYEYFKRL